MISKCLRLSSSTTSSTLQRRNSTRPLPITARSYLDIDAGLVVTISEDLLREAEERGDEDPDLPDWQKDEWEIAKRIVSTDRFMPRDPFASRHRRDLS